MITIDINDLDDHTLTNDLGISTRSMSIGSKIPGLKQVPKKSDKKSKNGIKNTIHCLRLKITTIMIHRARMALLIIG